VEATVLRAVGKASQRTIEVNVATNPRAWVDQGHGDPQVDEKSNGVAALTYIAIDCRRGRAQASNRFSAAAKQATHGVGASCGG